MIRNSRKMNDFKIYLKEILEKEYETCDVFNAKVEAGMITSEKLRQFSRKIKNETYFDDKLTYVKKDDIMSNPYLHNIKIPNIQENNICLSRKRFLPDNIVAAYNEKVRDIQTFEQINSYYICDRPLHLPGIVEADNMVCWMTVEPFEINSFADFIKTANGNVLLLGCGLGYASYMLSLKEDVKKIVVVDNNPDVIKLFKENILCQFEQKDKIQVVESDALEYMNHTDLNSFDYVNVDIWRDTRDMLLTYLPCLEIEKMYPNVSFSYWLESELKQTVQKGIMAAACDFNIEFHGLIIERIGQDIIEKTPIQSRDDFIQLFQLNNFRYILYNWYIENKAEFENMKKIELGEIDDLMGKIKTLQKRK